MHLHTFFSFNIAGFSPSHVAVQARDWDLYAAATTDFDVLDADDEFLAAASVLGLRAAAHIESRVYPPEFAAVETNSPGEPGICYVMGAALPRAAQVFPGVQERAALCSSHRRPWPTCRTAPCRNLVRRRLIKLGDDVRRAQAAGVRVLVPDVVPQAAAHAVILDQGRRRLRAVRTGA